MPSSISSVILIGYDRHDVWGSIDRRPARAAYVIHGATAPYICNEGATFHNEDRPENSMILRSEDEGFTYDVAYFVLTQCGNFDEDIAASGYLPGCKGWLHDPRDAEEDIRAEFHGAISDRMREAGLRLQIVRFGEYEFPYEHVQRLEEMGATVDVFDLTHEGQNGSNGATS